MKNKKKMIFNLKEICEIYICIIALNFKLYTVLIFHKGILIGIFGIFYNCDRYRCPPLTSPLEISSWWVLKILPPTLTDTLHGPFAPTKTFNSPLTINLWWD